MGKSDDIAWASWLAAVYYQCFPIRLVKNMGSHAAAEQVGGNSGTFDKRIVFNLRRRGRVHRKMWVHTDGGSHPLLCAALLAASHEVWKGSAVLPGPAIARLRRFAKDPLIGLTESVNKAGSWSPSFFVGLLACGFVGLLIIIIGIRHRAASHEVGVPCRSQRPAKKPPSNYCVFMLKGFRWFSMELRLCWFVGLLALWATWIFTIVTIIVIFSLSLIHI